MIYYVILYVIRLCVQWDHHLAVTGSIMYVNTCNQLRMYLTVMTHDDNMTIGFFFFLITINYCVWIVLLLKKKIYSI